jgi:hypothetical protein
MTRSRALRLPGAMVVVLLAAAPAIAANARLERVLLLPSPDRSSVVLELTAEPRQVSTRRISESIVEVDAGPGVDTAAPQLLKAPAAVRFIDSVSVRIVPTPLGAIVRARITMTSAAQAAVRSSGRRVYVDISKAPALPAAAAVGAGPARMGAPAATPAPAAATVAGDEAYRAGVRPVIAKLQELAPFLTSAAAAGDGSVTTAVLPALSSARASLASLEPPDAARGSHVMVLAAVDRVLRALAPEFSGDRASVVRQAMTTIEVVGGVLAGE